MDGIPVDKWIQLQHDTQCSIASCQLNKRKKRGHWRGIKRIIEHLVLRGATKYGRGTSGIRGEGGGFPESFFTVACPIHSCTLKSSDGLRMNEIPMFFSLIKDHSQLWFGDFFCKNNGRICKEEKRRCLPHYW